MIFISLLAVAYIIFALFLQLRMPDKYTYRKPNLVEKIVDILFIPFMEAFTDGKDAHWWDWEIISADAVNEDIEHAQYTTPWPKKRKFIHLPIVGQYNLRGVIDLYITLRVLPDVAIIKPVDYDGEWSLLVKAKHIYGTIETYSRCKFSHKGAVKHLVDGHMKYLGITKEGVYIPVEVVEVSSRRKNKELLFI